MTALPPSRSILQFNVIRNYAPEFTSTPVTYAIESIEYRYYMEATDENSSDELTFNTNVLPSWLYFSPSSNLLIGTPSELNIGKHNVSFSVTDGTETIVQNFTIDVIPFTNIKTDNKNGILIFPNPTNENITISFGTTINEGKTEIFDISGKLLFSDIFQQKEQKTYNIKKIGMDKGIYFVKIIVNDSDLYCFKLIVNN